MTANVQDLIGKISHQFMRVDTVRSGMSDATKVVIGTIGISTAMGVAIIVNHAMV